MKKIRCIIAALLIAILVLVNLNSISVYANGIRPNRVSCHAKKSSGNYSLRRNGHAHKYVEVHNDFNLKVKAGHSIKNSELYWDIKNPDIATYECDNKGGRKIEVYAMKTGTTKITCRCTNKNAAPKSITYTIHVVHDD